MTRIGPAAVSIVNVGYRSTNFWVVCAGRSRLLVDLGWPGRFRTFEANLTRMGIPLSEVTHGLATHYHLDHAGAAQDLKRQGIRLIVTEEQLGAIPAMKRHVKPADGYAEITLHDNVVISCAESRAYLAKLGIAGILISTPGHSDDSVTLVLDSGEAFTGDLTPPMLATEETAAVIARSWETLRAHGATMVYPGHGPIRPALPTVSR